MVTALGTSTSQYANGAVNTRAVAYSSISGTAQWYAVYNSGSAWVYCTSTDGSTWTSPTTITGIGYGLSTFYYPATLEADSNGILHLNVGSSNSGGTYYTQYTASGWWATPIYTSGLYNGVQGMPYVSGGHTYASRTSVLNTNTNVGISVNVDPASGGSINTANSETTASATNILCRPAGANCAIELVNSLFVLMGVDSATPPNLFYHGWSPTTVTTGTNVTATNAFSVTNLQGTYATLVDSGGTLHVIYRVSGTGWLEATYNGTSWTTAGALTQITDSDTYPTLAQDASGTLHLFYGRYNAANDYGIGHITKASGGSWAAQSDLVAHNSTNRTSLSVTRKDTGNALTLTWLDGTASPWTVQAQAVSTGGGATTAKTLGALGVG